MENAEGNQEAEVVKEKIIIVREEESGNEIMWHLGERKERRTETSRKRGAEKS